MKALYKWFAYKLPIRSKLLISFSILVMVPILVLGIYSYQQSKENTERQIRSTMESNLARLTSELDTRFQREGSTVRFLAYNLTFRNALENSGASAMTMAQVMNTSVEPTFWYFIAGDSYVKGMAVYSTKVRDKIGNFLLPVDDTVSQQAWYQQALDSYATHWTYDGVEICANRAILDTNSSSEVIAVLRMFCYPASLLDATDSMNYLDNGIRIVDENGQTVYARNSGVDALDEAVRLLAEDGSETAALGQGVLYKSRMEVSGWSIYYYLDKANITKELQPILNTTILVVLICLFLSIAVINLLATALTRRILKLQEYAEYVAEGHLDKELSTTDTDEIGVVTNSMGQMTHRLNDMIHQVYTMEIEKKASELRALQAMINPHFLYNSLSNIKWKALRSGNDDISEITGLLAKFYRTCLNNGQPLTTVRSELENIKAYVRIQQLTHDNGFDAEYDIEESQLDYQMLNFMLQPIVENAVKHGLEYEEEDGKGHICIECRGEDEFIVFRVINNGGAIDLQKVAEVMRTPGTGYGIYNICERIELYYGPGSGLFPSITEDGETCFTLKLNRTLEKETPTEA